MRRGAGADMIGRSEVTTGARIHGSYKHEVGWVDGFLLSARYSHEFVLKRLTKRFKDVAGIF